VLVASKLKAAIKNMDAQMAGEFLSDLNEHVHELVHKAVARAKGNGRKTVRGSDL
jgi:histone H3/H4